VIPVNLITGFLGVGKTTALRHLLRHHAAGEHWAVLVNEFGEIGIDGGLLADTGAAVLEVAGGCLCCVAAPAFTTGLNRLIRRHRPDRILIEPSGLGHPAQVLDTLAGPLYADVLEMRATICLIDARHLSSPRHREHQTFQDQIHLADVLVANKGDLYSAEDEGVLEAFAAALRPPKQRIGRVERGRLEPAWLDLPRGRERRAAFPEAHAFLVEQAHARTAGPADEVSDWLLIEGVGDGYRRAGWRIRPHRRWPEGRLRALLDGLTVERRKGVLLAEHGWLALNEAEWTRIAAPPDGFARLELIDAAQLDAQALDRRLRDLDGS
jgi:G3E family GTPase